MTAGLQAPHATAAPDGATLLRALRDVERPFLRESSAKAAHGALRTGRFLVSFPRGALGPGPSRRLRAIWAELGAPPDGRAELDALQPRAVSVHFGFEPEPAGAIFKCYLEFAADTQPAADMVFLALKWRPSAGDAPGAVALTRYWARDRLAPEAQSALADAILPGGPVREAMRQLMGLSPTTGALRLLEVEEPANPRRSLDLNLAQAERPLGELANPLTRLLGGAAEGTAYIAAHAGERLGHVAAGVARDGHTFATVYHGAGRIHPERA